VKPWGQLFLIVPVIAFGQQQLWPGTTEPSKGKHLVRELGTRNLHSVFLSPTDEVCYSFSSDGGSTWSPQELIFSTYPADTPSIALIYPGVQAPFPCVTFCFSNYYIGYRYRTPTGWQGFDLSYIPIVDRISQAVLATRDDNGLRFLHRVDDEGAVCESGLSFY